MAWVVTIPISPARGSRMNSVIRDRVVSEARERRPPYQLTKSPVERADQGAEQAGQEDRHQKRPNHGQKNGGDEK
jgi:hypothetical protein